MGISIWRFLMTWAAGFNGFWRFGMAVGGAHGIDAKWALPDTAGDANGFEF